MSDAECRWDMNNYGSPVCSAHGDNRDLCERNALTDEEIFAMKFSNKRTKPPKDAVERTLHSAKHWRKVRDTDPDNLTGPGADTIALADEIESLRAELNRYPDLGHNCSTGRHRCRGHFG